MSELVSFFIGFEQERASTIVEALAKISVGDRLTNSLPWDAKYEDEAGVISGFAGIEKKGYELDWTLNIDVQLSTVTVPIFASINVGNEFGVLTLQCAFSDKIKVELVNHFTSLSNIILFDTDNEVSMKMLFPMDADVAFDENRCFDNGCETVPDYFVSDALKAIG